MGAWGYGLFQSDHDLDIIGDLGDEVGLTKLEKDAQDKLRAEEEAKGIKHGEDDYENSIEGRISYSMSPSYCTDVDAVRNHLKNSGELEKVIEKWTAKTRGPRDNTSFFDPGYTLVLLGACAMMYGCTLKQDFIEYLRSIFLNVGLMTDALKEVDTALNGPHGFKNGEPYKWGPQGVHDKANALKTGPSLPKKSGTNFMGVHGMNVASPGGLFAGPDNSNLALTIRMRMQLIKKQKPDDVCGECGAPEGKDGQGLLNCAKCKCRKYCSKECQKAHWSSHKLMCAAPPGDPSNSGRVKGLLETIMGNDDDDDD